MKINVCKSERMELNAESQRTQSFAEKSLLGLSALLRVLCISALSFMFFVSPGS